MTGNKPEVTSAFSCAASQSRGSQRRAVRAALRRHSTRHQWGRRQRLPSCLIKPSNIDSQAQRILRILSPVTRWQSQVAVARTRARRCRGAARRPQIVGAPGSVNGRAVGGTAIRSNSVRNARQSPSRSPNSTCPGAEGDAEGVCTGRRFGCGCDPGAPPSSPSGGVTPARRQAISRARRPGRPRVDRRNHASNDEVAESAARISAGRRSARSHRRMAPSGKGGTAG